MVLLEGPPVLRSLGEATSVGWACSCIKELFEELITNSRVVRIG
ncbi:MAG: hypothetical protein QXG15_06415 [Desulfurococcaceae archaeon]